VAGLESRESKIIGYTTRGINLPVRSGDTPWGISQKSNMSVAEFLNYNPQFGSTIDKKGNLNAQKFEPGMYYRIPIQVPVYEGL
jgi:hypothetical protein